MKKLFFLFAVVGAFTFASCGAEQSNNPDDIEEAETTEQSTPQEADQPAPIEEESAPADSSKTEEPKKTEETTTVNP